MRLELARQRNGDWGGAAGFLALGLFLFRESLFQGFVLYKRDIHLVWHPQVESFVRCVLAGSWPIWNPSLGFGQPFLADAQVFYPPTWLNLVLRPWTCYALLSFAHFVLSAVGLLALARRLGLGPDASRVAAGCWALSGPYLSMLDLWHHYDGASWIPWVLLAGDRMAASSRARDVVLFGSAFALQILAGSADMCAMTLLAGGALVGARHLDFRHPAGGANLRLLLRSAAGVALALGVSAGLWLPALDLLRTASRAALPESVRTYWSLHPLAAFETLVPRLLSGLPLSASMRARLFESREPFLTSLYLGLPACALVFAGASCSKHPLRRFFVLLLGAAGLTSLGSHLPVYGLVTTLVPPLRILRYPVKFMTLVALSWAFLSGLGVAAWSDSLGSRRRWFACVVTPLGTLAAAALTLALVVRYAPPAATAGLLKPAPSQALAALPLEGLGGRLLVAAAWASLLALLAVWRARSSSSALGLVVAGLAVFDLALLHRSPSPLAPRELYTVQPQVVAAIEERAAPRVYVYDYSVPGKVERYLGGSSAYALARQPGAWSYEAAAALGMQTYLAPETAGRWALSQAYNIDYRGLSPNPLARLCKLLRDVEETPAELRLLQAGGVTHTVSLHALPGLEPLRTIPGFFERPILLSAVPGTRPRTYVAAGVPAPSDDAAIAALLDPRFDLAHEVLVASGSTARDPEVRGESRILGARPDRVTIEARLSNDGHVVLLDSYDPGWRATVDGLEAPVRRANLAFRAVPVSAGRHRVELVYRPRGLGNGLFVAALSLAIGGLVLAFGARG